MLNDAIQRQAGRLGNVVDLSREAQTTLTVEDLLGANAHREDPNAVLDDLVGQEEIKAKIKEYEAVITDAKERGDNPAEYFEPYFLFSGNPGIGKTTVAKKMGKIFQRLGFLPSEEVAVKDAAELVMGYEGQTAGNVEHLPETRRKNLRLSGWRRPATRRSDEPVLQTGGRAAVELAHRIPRAGRRDLGRVRQTAGTTHGRQSGPEEPFLARSWCSRI